MAAQETDHAQQGEGKIAIQVVQDRGIRGRYDRLCALKRYPSQQLYYSRHRVYFGREPFPGSSSPHIVRWYHTVTRQVDLSIGAAGQEALPGG